MKLKTLLPEQRLNEDVIGGFLNYVTNLINTGRTESIKKEVQGEFKKKLETLERNRKDLEEYVKGNLSKEEIMQLYNKIKK